MAEKKASAVKLTGVQMKPKTVEKTDKEGNKYEQNLMIVRTELPKSITDAQYKMGFVAIPAKMAYTKPGSEYGTANLGDPSRDVNIQYKNKSGERVTAKFSAEELGATHKEAQNAYFAERKAKMAEKAAEIEASAPSAEAETEAEA